MPLLPPVMTAIFPLSLDMVWFLCGPQKWRRAPRYYVYGQSRTEGIAVAYDLFPGSMSRHVSDNSKDINRSAVAC